MAALTDKQYLIYRGKPLVRAGNTYCYGDMRDDYVLFMIVLSEKPASTSAGESKVMVPDRILLQVLSTDPKKSSGERIAKQLEKQGLYDALDIGIVWLERLNKG